MVDRERTNQLLAMLARYAEPARVHELLRTHLGDFDRFARAIAEHLAKPDENAR